MNNDYKIRYFIETIYQIHRYCISFFVTWISNQRELIFQKVMPPTQTYSRPYYPTRMGAHAVRGNHHLTGKGLGVNTPVTSRLKPVIAYGISLKKHLLIATCNRVRL